jgi:hypothetical protein
MMSCLASVERSRRQWVVLLGEVGMSVREVCGYVADTGDNVIVAVQKWTDSR